MLRASRGLHALMRSACCARTAWFDATPVGRIQNRFSSDFQQVDRVVSQALGAFLNNFFTPVMSMYAIGIELPLLVPACAPAMALGATVALRYMKAARDLKRIDSTTRSPVYALFNESLNGVQTLRSFDGAVARFRDRFCERVDGANRAELSLNNAAAGWVCAWKLGGRRGGRGAHTARGRPRAPTATTTTSRRRHLTPASGGLSTP